MLKNGLNIKESIFLLVELTFIFIYFLSAFTEFILTLQMYNNHLTSSKYYFYNLVHKRITFESFNSVMTLKNPEQNCPIFPESTKYKPNNVLQYEARKILELGSFVNTRITDKTNVTFLYDNFKSEKVIKNITEGTKYNYFNLQNKGDTTINLMTNYQFNSWKEIKFCVLKLDLVDQKAVALIPKNENCTKLLNNKKVLECGIYLDTYKMCIQYDHLKMNETYKLDKLEYSNWDSDWGCPFNYFNIDFTFKPNVNFSDPDDIPIKGDLFTMFKNEIPDLKLKEKYNKYIDKYLFYDLDTAILGDYQQIEKPMDDFIFAGLVATEYSIGDKYGYKDSFNGIIDDYDFIKMYNDTYYLEPVYNAKTGNTTYLPQFLEGNILKTYYMPEETSKNPLKALLTYYGYPVLSKECFTDFIQKKQNWFWLDSVKLIETDFMDESLPLLIAWIGVQLFISYFWHFKTRFVLILQKLRTGHLHSPDEKSDLETKFTTRFSGFIMFALTIHGTTYQSTQFDYITSMTDSIIKYKCYPDQLTLDSFKEFGEYVRLLDAKNNIIYYLLLICAAMELILIVFHSLELYSKIAAKRKRDEENYKTVKSE